MYDFEYRGFKFVVEYVSGIWVYYICGFPKVSHREYDSDVLATQAGKNCIDKVLEIYQSEENV